jgi:DNA polymerase-3 subunit alpha (Gram-positive type)
VEFCEGAVLVAHNANFDMSFINENIRRQRIKVNYTYIDTLGLARVLLPGQAKHTLDAVCKTLKISLENVVGNQTKKFNLEHLFARM